MLNGEIPQETRLGGRLSVLSRRFSTGDIEVTHFKPLNPRRVNRSTTPSAPSLSDLVEPVINTFAAFVYSAPLTGVKSFGGEESGDSNAGREADVASRGQHRRKAEVDVEIAEPTISQTLPSQDLTPKQYALTPKQYAILAVVLVVFNKFDEDHNNIGMDEFQKVWILFI